jgi:uncharacterized protein (DUF2062 family)
VVAVELPYNCAIETGCRLRTRYRKFFKSTCPVTACENRHIARFGGFLRHPNLWHLNRHSVAGGVVGMFSGLIPGHSDADRSPSRVPLRVNLPVALATTLYTNPLTIGPLYVLAYLIGRLIMGGGGAALSAPPEMQWSQLGASLDAFVRWTLSMGTPLAVGLLALALGLAALGYACVQIGWRAYVIRAWRKRRQLRTQHGR